MTDSLFRKPRLRFHKDRILKAPLMAGPQPEPKPEVEAVAFSNTRDVIGKAAELEEAIVASISMLTIPVDEKSTEVMSAVKRRDKLSNGKFITFKLYMRALRSRESVRDITASEISQEFNLNRSTDSKIMSETIMSKVIGRSKEESSFILSQAIHLFKLQMMQGGLEALISQLQTATKLPNGTEAPVTLASLALSIAFLIEYTDNTIDQVKEVFKELSGGRANIDQAAEMSKDIDLSALPIAQLALDSKIPGDYDLILLYSNNFLTTTRKLGYEPWILLADVRSIKSRGEKDLLQEGRFDPSQIDPSVFDVVNARAQSSSRSLDRIATSLTAEHTSLSELCSLEWLLKVPKEAIAMIQSILDVALSLKGIKLKSFLDSDISVSGWGFLTDLLYDVIDLFSTVSGKLLCWFQRDPELWDILYECPPVGELVDACITALEDVERVILSRFDGVLDDLAKHERAIVVKAGFVEELKKLRQMLAKVELVRNPASTLRAVKDISKIKVSSEVFRSAGKSIELRVKEKSDNLRDFVKRPFKESGFVNPNPSDAPQHFDIPSVPYGSCDLRGFSGSKEDIEKLAKLRREEQKQTFSNLGPVKGIEDIGERFADVDSDMKDLLGEGTE